VYGASFAHTAPGGGAGPLLTWSSDGRLNLWEVEEATGTVEPLDTLAYSGFAVYGAAFSPLGDRLACAGGASNDCCNSHGHPRTLVVHRLGPSP
jgi:WD40 repeat protein